MYNGRETSTRALDQAALLGAIAFLFPDNGTSLQYTYFLFARPRITLRTLFTIMIEYDF